MSRRTEMRLRRRISLRPTATILVDHRLLNGVLELQPETDIDLSRCWKAIQDAGHGRDGCDVANRPDVRPRYRKVGVIESIGHDEANLESHLFPQVEVLHEREIQVGDPRSF